MHNRFMGDQAGVPSVGFTCSSASLQAADPLPGLPILCTTRLQLELLLKDSVIDLKAVTEVILTDVGATLQIMRLSGEEFPSEDDRPTRIEDCIVSLSLARCYQAICAWKGPNSGPHVAEWQHCRRLAECARELARSLDGYSPEEAYLVGLLCRLGQFPQLLGWKHESTLSAESSAVGLMLACHWNLPACVVLVDSRPARDGRSLPVERHSDACPSTGRAAGSLVTARLS